MAQIDRSDALRVVQELTAASTTYHRHFILWLGVGSAGGAVAILSFAANLPNPDHALRALLPSLIAFAVGVAFAATCVLAMAKREGSAAHHHGQAFNRDQLDDAIRATPEFITAPRSLGEEMNAGRNKLIGQNHKAHETAEAAWAWRQRWHYAYLVCAGLSAVSFLVGVGWPIVYIATGGALAPKP